MKIESFTYFEMQDRDCQVAFGYQCENEILKVNPPFIMCENVTENDYFFVENTHEDEAPKNKSFADRIPVGFWRINYKYANNE